MGVRKSQTQVTDAKAVGVVKDLYDDMEWTTYDIRPDYGIDQQIEILEKGKHTAVAAYVQIKGHLKLKKGKGGFASQEIECEHLEYYLNTNVPVFLIVVDVGSKEGFWVFIQEYAHTHLSGGEWRVRLHGSAKEPKVTVRVPLANRLADRQRFKEAVIRARRYLASRLISEGLAYDRESFERLDPRFRITVTASEQGKHFNLRPVENVPVTLSFAKSFVESGKYHTLVGRGLPVTLEPGEIKAEGSLLIQDIFERAMRNKGAFHVAQNVEVGLSLIRVNKEGEVAGRIDPLPCRIQGGMIECRFVARTSNGMLELSSDQRLGQTGPSTANVSYDLTPWYGRPVLNLPYFDAFAVLFAASSEGERLRFEFHYEGERLSGGYIVWEGIEAGGVSAFVEVVSQARCVAGRLKVNPVLPRLDESSTNEVEALYGLLNGKEIVRPWAGGRVNAVVAGETADNFFRFIADQGGTYNLRHDEKATFPFLGLELDIGLVVHRLSDMRLGNDLDGLKRRQDAGEVDIPVSFIGSETTRLILRIADDGDPSLAKDGMMMIERLQPAS